MSRNHTKDNCFNKSLLAEHKQKLIQAIKRIKHEIDECWDAERETYAQALSVENTFDDLEREIRSEYQNLHRFLDLEEEMDVERLTKDKEKRVKLLGEREKKISEQGKDLERAIETLNSKLKEEDSPKLLNDIKDLLKRCQVNFVPPSAVNAEIQAGQFIGPLQYKIWKHMKSSLYPNIATFTFDTDTAHPLLRLSPCSTSVWFEVREGTPPEPEPNNPRRFHYYYCLLGQEGFTHGRHYWEVEPIFPFFNPCDTDEGKNTAPLTLFSPSL